MGLELNAEIRLGAHVSVTDDCSTLGRASDDKVWTVGSIAREIERIRSATFGSWQDSYLYRDLWKLSH